MTSQFKPNPVTVDVPEDLKEDLEQIWDALFEDRDGVLAKGEDMLQGDTVSGGFDSEKNVFRFVYVSGDSDKKDRKWLLELTETEIGRLASGTIKQITVDERPHGKANR